MKCSKFFKKVLLSILVFSLTMIQLDCKTTFHAIEKVPQVESEPFILEEDETIGLFNEAVAGMIRIML